MKQQKTDVFNQIANIVRPENELPGHLTLLVTGTGKRDSETGNENLLLRTCDHAIYLPENAPATLAHTIVDRYNEYQQQAKDIQLLREALKLSSYQHQTYAELDQWDNKDEEAYTKANEALIQTEPK